MDPLAGMAWLNGFPVAVEKILGRRARGRLGRAVAEDGPSRWRCCRRSGTRGAILLAGVSSRRRERGRSRSSVTPFEAQRQAIGAAAEVGRRADAVRADLPRVAPGARADRRLRAVDGRKLMARTPVTSTRYASGHEPLAEQRLPRPAACPSVRPHATYSRASCRNPAPGSRACRGRSPRTRARVPRARPRSRARGRARRASIRLGDPEVLDLRVPAPGEAAEAREDRLRLVRG